MTVPLVVYHDKPYLELARRILDTGNDRGDRTGTGTRSLFGQQMRFDLSYAYPLLTTKQTAFRLIAEELLWFLRGETNIRSLVLKNVPIWNEWPYKAYLKKQGLQVPSSDTEEWKAGISDFIMKIVEDESFAEDHGDLGPVYGSQWRKWSAGSNLDSENDSMWSKWNGLEFQIDQIAKLVYGLKNKPESRDHIVSAWNPKEHQWLRENSLPPCHVLFQCYVANGRLSLHLYQRSCDYFLGVPFNIASYALLTHMLAHVTGLQPGELVWTGGDVHIYNNHFDQISLQLTRDPLPSPQMSIVGAAPDIYSFTMDNFELIDYEHLGAIKGDIAV